jgi:hypothetical protein
VGYDDEFLASLHDEGAIQIAQETNP